MVNRSELRRRIISLLDEPMSSRDISDATKTDISVIRPIISSLKKEGFLIVDSYKIEFINNHNIHIELYKVNSKFPYKAVMCRNCNETKDITYFDDLALYCNVCSSRIDYEKDDRLVSPFTYSPVHFQFMQDTINDLKSKLYKLLKENYVLNHELNNFINNKK